MKVAIKLPAFLQPRTNRHEDLAPDTAILEDLLPDDAFQAPRARSAAGARPGGVEEPLARASAEADASAPVGLARSRDRFQVPLIGSMPFRKQLEVWLPLLFVAVLIAFVFLWVDARQAIGRERIGSATLTLGRMEPFC